MSGGYAIFTSIGSFIIRIGTPGLRFLPGLPFTLTGGCGGGFGGSISTVYHWFDSRGFER